MMYGWGMGWVGMLIGGLIFLGLTITVVYFIIRLAQGNGRTSSGQTYNSGSEAINRALDILAERYAHGEINEQEYTRMKNELKK